MGLFGKSKKEILHEEKMLEMNIVAEAEARRSIEIQQAADRENQLQIAKENCEAAREQAAATKYQINQEINLKRELAEKQKQAEMAKAESSARQIEAVERTKQMTVQLQAKNEAEQIELNKQKITFEHNKMIAQQKNLELESKVKTQLAEIQNELSQKEAVEKTEQVRMQEDTKQKQLLTEKEIAFSKQENENIRLQMQNEAMLQKSKNEADIKITEIEAQKETELAEINARREMNHEDFLLKQQALGEMKELFCAQLKAISEMYKLDIENLYKDNLHRREINLKIIEGARKEKEQINTYLLSASGQMKCNYEDKLTELELTINHVLEDNKAADEELKSKLALISYKQSLDNTLSNKKMLSMETLFIGTENE